MILLYNFVFVLLSFVLFSLGGWSLIAPFGRQLPFPSARAALAGLAAVPCATLSIHVVLELAYWKAAIIACFVLIGGSLVSVSIYGARDVFRRIDTVVILTVMLAGTAAFTTTRSFSCPLKEKNRDPQHTRNRDRPGRVASLAGSARRG